MTDTPDTATTTERQDATTTADAGGTAATPEFEKPAPVERYLHAWNDHDSEAVVAQFADGGTYVDPTLDEPLVGPEIGEYVAEVAEGFPDLRFEERRLLATHEEGVYVSEWTMYGIHKGPLDGLPPTGNAVELDGVDVAVVSEDGIESIRGYFDQEEFAEQLGLTFPAVLGQIPTLAAGAVRQRL